MIVTTRSEPGQLDRALATLGATVLHVPLISIERLPVADLHLSDAAWLVVTSQHGAAAVGGFARQHPLLRLAAVGTRTAAVLSELAGRPVDLVPDRQTAVDLVAAFPEGSGRVVAALGDLAAPTLADGVAAKGWQPDVFVVYRTHLAPVDPDVRAAVLSADAVTFASGSAVSAWVRAIGIDTPPIAVAIGPSTQQVAAAAGVAVTHVAATFDIDGLTAAVVDALAEGP